MKKPTNIIQQLLVLSMIIPLFISGCSSKVPLVSVPVAMPSAFSQSGTADTTGEWWLAFNDDSLNTLIDQALGNNFSLQSSWDRLNQAKATYRKNSASLFPAFDGEAGGSHSATDSSGSTVKTDKILLGLSAQYEVDLWGRISSTVDAARLDMEATAADLDTAAMTLAAEVAVTWYQLVQQNSSIGLLDEQIATNRQGLELISAQFRTGQVSIADVLQQRQLIEAKTGEKVQLVAEYGQSQHQLAILLGLTPGTQSFDIPFDLVALPTLPKTGIPAELILARPDIRSAFHSVEAADKRVAAAVADRFPALRFSASLETSASSAADLFSSYLTTVAASLVGPIIDGGQRKAEVERTRALASEQLHDLGQAILVAFGEVEDALLQERQQLLYVDSLQLQLDLARQTMKQVKERYLKGVENYQRVLSALTSLQSLEQNKLAAQKNLLVNRIELCRALGRDWKFSEDEEK